MNIVGKTEDGKLVVNGVFKLKDTFGFPLDITVDLLHQNNMIVDWLSFWEDGINSGWKPDTILNTINTTIGDVFGNKYCENFMKRFKFSLMKGS